MGIQTYSFVARSPASQERRTIMDPATLCCPNLACPARGHVGQGNIGIHSRQHQRFICTQCRKTCAATKGTALSRLRTPSRPCGGGWGATTPRTTGIGRGRCGREPCGEPGRPQHGCEAPDTGTHRQRWQPGGPIRSGHGARSCCSACRRGRSPKGCTKFASAMRVERSG